MKTLLRFVLQVEDEAYLPLPEPPMLKPGSHPL